ncbi:hypothetical protein TDB9533_04254 [Thalassocella blandensis]|nr:hypothetical protein TDB9533_04254 [Thalassocella blandensis]
MRWCLLFYAVFFSVVVKSAPITVVHNKVSTKNEEYVLGLLALALSYSAKDYEFAEVKEVYNQARQQEEVFTGSLSVFWAGTSKSLEEKFQPVRIPLFKGLLGHRVLLIRKGDQSRFDQVSSLEALKQIRFGQGSTWADTEILRAAGFNLITAPKYQSLFYMLDGKRFDAFPRGVHEPWQEVVKFKALDLAVEERLMLVYRMPLYFFVSKSNSALYQDINEGLEKAIADGSFDTYFLQHPLTKEVLRMANMDNRRIFYLQNPFAHPETPFDRKELWYR